jgi:MFS transporter
VEQSARLDFVLQLGNVAESVEVASRQETIESSNAAIARAVDNKRVVDLPLKGHQFLSLFPPLKAEFAASDVQLGLIGTAFLWVYGVTSPLSGFLADRFSRKRIIISSLFIRSVVTWLTGQVDSFNQLLGAREPMGISEASYIPCPW